jgi:beta-glucanase (GH16 family)
MTPFDDLHLSIKRIVLFFLLSCLSALLTLAVASCQPDQTMSETQTAKAIPSARPQEASITPWPTFTSRAPTEVHLTPRTVTTTPTRSPSPTPSPTSDVPPGANWVLAWSDEFEGEALNTQMWKPYLYKRAEDYNKTAYRKHNIEVSSGILKLYVRQETAGNADYTGGMLESIGAYERNRYGYFVARIRYQLIGPGFWANFWMTGSDRWPPEFDHEVVTQRNHGDEILQAYHFVDENGENQVSKQFVAVNYNEWHTYGIKWLPNQPVQFFLDDRLTFTSDAPVNNPPDVDMAVVLRAGAFQSAQWGGLPDDTTQWPGMAEYDWVRVYQYAGATPAP